ncbi:MAG: helix-turn-helix transcriptional regulator [Pseudomonadota bacterium]
MAYSIKNNLTINLRALLRATARVTGMSEPEVMESTGSTNLSVYDPMEKLPVEVINGIVALIDEQSKVAHTQGPYFTKRLKAARCYAGLTRTELSRFPGLNVTRDHPRQWEEGIIAPSTHSLSLIAKAVDLPESYFRWGDLDGIPPDHILGRKIGAPATASAMSLKVWQAINNIATGSREAIFEAIARNVDASRLSRECGGYFDGADFHLWKTPEIEPPKVRAEYDPLVASASFKHDVEFTRLMRDLVDEILDNKITREEARRQLNEYRAARGEPKPTPAALNNAINRAKDRREKQQEQLRENEAKARSFANDPFLSAIWTFNN